MQRASWTRQAATAIRTTTATAPSAIRGRPRRHRACRENEGPRAGCLRAPRAGRGAPLVGRGAPAAVPANAPGRGARARRRRRRRAPALSPPSAAAAPSGQGARPQRRWAAGGGALAWRHCGRSGAPAARRGRPRRGAPRAAAGARCSPPPAAGGRRRRAARRLHGRQPLCTPRLHRVYDGPRRRGTRHGRCLPIGCGLDAAGAGGGGACLPVLVCRGAPLRRGVVGVGGAGVVWLEGTWLPHVGIGTCPWLRLRGSTSV